jgi:pyruvate-formate lyase
MKHSDIDYWRALQSAKSKQEIADRPTPRVCRLLLRAMEDWNAKPKWLREIDVGDIYQGLSQAQKLSLQKKPVAIRKALAVAKMLHIASDGKTGASTGACRVNTDELIIGTLPPFSVGQGKEVVKYLTDEEQLKGLLTMVNEWSPMGHVVPDHSVVLDRGLKALIATCEQMKQTRTSSATFYDSVKICLESVIAYSERYAEIAEQLAESLAAGEPDRTTLLAAAKRLRNSPALPPRTFHEAVQTIYIIHCALHWTAEIVPFGRLDQLLYPFYKKDIAAKRLTEAEAQEILDCFWIKLDEKVILNRRHAEDRFTWADGMLTGSPFGPFFDQGGLLNQWMQQITIGGVIADGAAVAKDATNPVTYLLLNCARRLPLNSPTLDLRVHGRTPKKLYLAAAQTLLSGGAHPVILNDDRIVPGLKNRTGGKVSLASARNYACDGCYETMFAGETEFSFGFVPALDCLELALNRGARFKAAGTVHLRGEKASWRTRPVSELGTFEELWTELTLHIRLGCHIYLNNLLRLYGTKSELAPSPLLSALIGGCLESGRDISAGGARYHLFSPLMTGISSAADSLTAIKTLVFEQHLFSLEELVSCLLSDWGNRLDTLGRYVSSERCRKIRNLCMNQPKFGQGNQTVDCIAWRLIETFYGCVQKARQHPLHDEQLHELRNKYGKEFEILLAPGVGTFEQYVFGGGMAGASADGRRAGKPVASDMSPAPIPDDQPAHTVVGDKTLHARTVELDDGLRSYLHDCMELLPDGAPADFNIREDFSVEKLADAIRNFAGPKGGSVCTFTVANPETFDAALRDPQRHNLLRVRMGGWTEFFIALFPDHQSQHIRRPLYV